MLLVRGIVRNGFELASRDARIAARRARILERVAARRACHQGGEHYIRTLLLSLPSEEGSS